MSLQVSRTLFLDAFGDEDDRSAARLSDVLALDTSAEDREKVLDALNAHGWKFGTRLPLTMPAGELSAIPLAPVDGVQINLYPGEIVAFDIELTAMRDQEAVDSVCEVARVIGQATGHPVVFVPEGRTPVEAVLTYDPATDRFLFSRAPDTVLRSSSDDAN